MVKNIIRNTAIALLTLAAACALSMIFQRLDVTEHITTAFVFAVFIISLLTEGYLCRKPGRLVQNQSARASSVNKAERNQI